MLQAQHQYQPPYSQMQETWAHTPQHQQKAQQAPQHYTRIAVNQNLKDSTNNATNVAAAATMGENTDPQVTEENRRVLQWVADLMEPSRRETALMEVSFNYQALQAWH